MDKNLIALDVPRWLCTINFVWPPLLLLSSSFPLILGHEFFKTHIYLIFEVDPMLTGRTGFTTGQTGRCGIGTFALLLPLEPQSFCCNLRGIFLYHLLLRSLLAHNYIFLLYCFGLIWPN